MGREGELQQGSVLLSTTHCTSHVTYMHHTAVIWYS